MMLEIIHKAFSSAVSEFLTVIIAGVFVIGFAVWFSLPFLFYSIRKELKRIREILEEKNKISLD